MELAKFSRNQLLFGGVALSLLITPYLACSSSTAHDPVDPNERTEALLGTWQGSAEIDGETIPFSLKLDRVPGKSVAERLEVVGSVTSENPAFDGALDGNFRLDAASSSAALSLRLDDGKVLLGTVEGDALKDGRILASLQAGAFSLARP